MANITLLGASYTDVPAVDLPQTGGGTVRFYENGGTPSATQHTILFEFEDETSTSITAYYDSAFISNAITATTPTEYGGKTVQEASLDGTTWYVKPSETWETLYDGNEVNFYPDNEPPAYCWIEELGDIWPSVGSVWRITFDGVLYDNLIAKSMITPWDQRERIIIGNSALYGEEFEDTGEPFVFYNIGYGAWIGGIEGPNVSSTHTLKVERLVA